MEYKCKICAGSLTIDLQTRVAICDYCGTKQTLPLFGDDSSKALYERGNQYLLHNEYDKAEGVFTQLLSVNPNDAEIYWDLVLCKYGVTYAKDPQTGKYIPTCNRTHTDSVLKDENYRRALELSVGEKAELYKRDAGIIENIQKGILELSRKENPFDVFISYKETDANGNRTRDSIEAQKLYEKLTELGYKVFFSRITLESKIGEEYEPYIYAALSSSKVMITVCSSSDNIQSAWVKNEWSRFLTLRRSNTSKTLIPVYFDMDETGLPEEFALLSAQNMRAEDFEQELIRGIKKLIPTPIILKERREKTRKNLIIAGVIALIIGIPVTLAIVIPAKKQAENEKQYTKAQNLYAEGKYEEAGEILNELDDYEDASELSKEITSQTEYSKAKELFTAGKYDDAKNIFEELGEYLDSAELAEKCSYQANFDEAMELYYDHKYPEATWAFQEIGDYDEVVKMRERCKKAWMEKVSRIAYAFTQEGTGSEFYIDDNGSVQSFSSNPNSEAVEIELNSSGEQVGQSPIIANEHGKVVSICEGYPANYALYEDGYVCNSAFVNGLDKNWENAIQISDQIEETNIALLDDGTISYGNKINFDYVRSWLEEIGSWTNIIKFDWAGTEGAYYEGVVYSGATIVGLDSKGKMHISVFNEPDEIRTLNNTPDYKQIMKPAQEYFDGISEISDISVAGDYITAIDKDNVLHVYNYSNGETSEIPSVKCTWGEYYTDSNNILKTIHSNNSILEGIVYLNDGYCVTQNGAIYKCDGNSTERKTEVKDVWLER